ncbi:DUF4843 domain-containing protein [Echinicola sp. 20G]|uniref:DUF4843 domain-containing protein n=1 Tax=Echinicola sp. 20G TaxID=2781961 RepID=UPI001910A0B3|nr:DUF4843 domain-containing protein [Echinicola sp. 20G]
MKKIIQNIYLLLAIVACWSCVEDELTTYESNKDSIYFTYSKEGHLATSPFDSLFYSVGLVPSGFTDSLISIPVKIIGKTTDYDRAFSLELSDRSTAVEGTNFKFESELTIPAGEVSSEILVRLYKTPDIAEDTVMLDFNLLPNDHFNTDMKSLINQFGVEELSYINFEVYLTGTITEPAYWFAPFLGPFSEKKILLMAEVLGIDPLIFTKSGVSVSKMMYYGKAMKRYLDIERAAGNTIYELDGSEMEMGPYF